MNPVRKREQAPRTPNAAAQWPSASDFAKRLECVRLAGACHGSWSWHLILLNDTSVRSAAPGFLQHPRAVLRRLNNNVVISSRVSVLCARESSRHGINLAIF